ncbi:LysM peptidoglycan-binding domain-containing protein [uncultured Sphingomonas sp.]|uniref:LysM peptidoglycan-binding domain-containing protein n=1 Tax=uncultured Sphingomonas sp. TaxID=158754 RepID=UPI0035CC2176
MTPRCRRALAACACVPAILVAACSHAPGAHPAAPSTKAPPAAAESDAILALLDQGNVDAARKRLKAALKRAPDDPKLAVLRDSLDRDPKDLLGPQSYPYTVQPGETMTGLAQRFLGNRLKAYQLARYNGVAKPAALAAGQVIRIPGEPPRRIEPAPVRTVEPAAPRSAPRVRAGQARPSSPKPAAAATAAAIADPAAARQARAAGLAALNQGRVGPAVGLLRRAAALDRGNPLIARDLARAERIAATVQHHR